MQFCSVVSTKTRSEKLHTLMICTCYICRRQRGNWLPARLQALLESVVAAEAPNHLLERVACYGSRDLPPTSMVEHGSGKKAQTLSRSWKICGVRSHLPQ